MPGRLATGREVAALLMARMLCLLWLVVAPILATPVHAAGLYGTGVVFLHGKGVWTGAFDGGIPGALEAEGAMVVSPEMPWSFGRSTNAPRWHSRLAEYAQSSSHWSRSADAGPPWICTTSGALPPS